ncbi:DUF4149 domain-containing protein [Singulisphaera rosea]
MADVVNARFLRGIFDSAYLLALTAWVGSLSFVLFGAASNALNVLGIEDGRRFSRAMLPRLYLWVSVAGAVALPSYLGVPLSFPEFRGPGVALQAFAIVAGILLMLYGGNTLAPAILDANERGVSDAERLHRRAIGLNFVTLGVGIALLLAFASRSAPKTEGIVEPDAIERARSLLEKAKSNPLDSKRTLPDSALPERSDAGP